MFRYFFVAFFVLNALFWGLFPHESHCSVAAAFTNVCPPHWVHLTMGLISFIIAILIAQWNYIRYLTSRA